MSSNFIKQDNFRYQDFNIDNYRLEIHRNIILSVLYKSGIDFETVYLSEFDGDRFYIGVDSEEVNYYIRTWDIEEDFITFTLFKCNDHNSADSIASGEYYFPKIFIDSDCEFPRL